jgi:hypothetical protein
MGRWVRAVHADIASLVERAGVQAMTSFSGVRARVHYKKAAFEAGCAEILTGNGQRVRRRQASPLKDRCLFGASITTDVSLLLLFDFGEPHVGTKIARMAIGQPHEGYTSWIEEHS